MKTGVTLIWAITGVVPLFKPLKDVISLLPALLSPIVDTSFVQLNTVLVTFPVKITGFVKVLLQTVWSVIAFTEGVGLTVTEKLVGLPRHVMPFAINSGVATIVDDTSWLLWLLALNDPIDNPVPELVNPMFILLLDQL